MFKNLIFSVFLTVIFIACNNSSETPPIEEMPYLDASNFNKAINENPEQGEIIGRITASTNDGVLKFTFLSNIEENPLGLDTKTGELFIVEKSFFDYEINKYINGTIKVESQKLVKEVNFEITIEDVIEPNDFALVSNINPIFTERYDHESIVFKEKMWVIGGYNNTEFLNDVWSSNDGINWNKENITGNVFSPRSNHQLFVFNEKIWLVGGRSKEIEYNDVWSSVDGINWIEEKESKLPFTVYGHEAVIFNDKIFILGGYVDGKVSNTIIYSANGKDWLQPQDSNTLFTKRADHQVTQFNNFLWVVGGFNGNNVIVDIWKSYNGLDWTSVSTEGQVFDQRANHQIVSYNDKVYLNCGTFDFYIHGSKDQWSTDNFINWKKENIKILSQGVNFDSIRNHQTIVFKNKIWILGGAKDLRNNNAHLNKIWYSN